MQRGALSFFCLTDRYLIKQMLPRMGVAMVITLAALLIERILRLFDLVTGFGAEIGIVLTLALNLLPHYIGLALPAAFCFAILTTFGTLSQSGEIDALENAGWSLRRIGLPFIVCSLFMAVFSLILFGTIQPYSRYAFQEIRHTIQTAGWKGRVEQATFFDLGKGLTLSVGDADPTARLFYRVFLVQKDEKGETVTTARRGTLIPYPDGQGVRLLLEEGQVLLPKGEVLKFDKLPYERRFDNKNTIFRERGDSHRELTFQELWQRMHPANGGEPERRFAVEFHSRLVRAFSLIAVALMSIPLGITRKRVPTWRRIVVAIAILAAYDNMIKFVSELAGTNGIGPVFGLWGLCGLFTVFSLWLYISTPSQGSNAPFGRLIDTLSRKLSLAGKRLAAASGASRDA